MIALGIESSATRGMGHLFRSLLYVQYLKENNIQCVYLINDDKKSLNILDNLGIEYVIVDYCDKASNWEAKIIDKFNIDIWINDKFETDVLMAKHIKDKNIYFALIDDIGDGEEIADANYIGLIGFSKHSFSSKSLRCGMDYVILNKDIEKFKHLRREVKKIIVSFGGSDPYSNTVPVVKRLMNSKFSFDITIGPNYKCEPELRLLNKDNRFAIYKNVPSLVELFDNYDLAITGGGVTCCEANAAGLPCLIIANAPHEVNTGKYLQERGGCAYIGDYNGWERDIVQVIENINVEDMSIRGMSIFNTDAVDNILTSIIKNAHINNGRD